MRAARLATLRPSSPAARRRLLVVEGGARVIGPESADGFDETVALLQTEGDNPADFADRVLRRLATAEHSGKSFDAVVWLIGSSSSASVQAARHLIALGINAHAVTSPRLSELVIVAKANVSEDLRYQLLELADELVLSSDHRPLPVSLRFGEPARELTSGVFERVTGR